MSPPLSLEKELAENGKRITDALHEAQRRAQESGKPLLILIGEDHFSAHSALLETMIYKQARALGIADVAFEVSKGLTSWMNKMVISSQTSHGSVEMYWQAHYYHAKIHAVDSRADLAMKMDKTYSPAVEPNRKDVGKFGHVEFRNETIAANLANIPRPALMVVGTIHLPGLCENPSLMKSHEVVCFDVSNPNVLGTMPIHNPRGTHRLIISATDVSELSANQVIDYGLGAKEGKNFREWAERRGHKLSIAQAFVTAVAVFPEHILNPNNYSLKYMEALHELGWDETISNSKMPATPVPSTSVGQLSPLPPQILQNSSTRKK